MDCISKKLEYYGQNTNLHGLRHVADKRKHPIFRLIWFVIWIISVVMMIWIIRETFRAYRSNAISFVTETTYLNWNTTFPAVTVCEMFNSETIYGEEDNLSTEVLDFIADMIFFTGSCYTCDNACEECTKLNFKKLSQKYRKQCKIVMGKCKFNNVVFDCCEKFLPVDSEYGICFSINSIHTRDGLNTKLLRSNMHTGPGELFMEIKSDVKLYFHAPEDVPFINSDPDHRKEVLLGEAHNVTINIIEIENDENVKYLPVEQRLCRYPWELTADIKVHKFYSYSTCIVQCHADNHVKLCNCTHHMMPVLSDEKFCGIEGLQCLTQYYETFNRLHAKGFKKKGLVCDCLPSCVEPEYKIVAESKDISTSGYSEIIIKMQNLPSSKFKRVVVRTTLDMVGSIGGAFGLFIGGSLLSIIETVYLLFIKPVRR